MVEATIGRVIIDELAEVLEQRRLASPETSYTARLLADNALIRRKIMEEAFEFCLELEPSRQEASPVAEEAADLIYHVLVGLMEADVPLASVYAALEKRRSSPEAAE